jgi:tRNA1Val (adenine37-N6)-methyltransferase
LSEQKFSFYGLDFLQKSGVFKIGTDAVALACWLNKNAPQKGKFIEVGCGGGFISLVYLKGEPNRFVYAIDINPEAFELCKQNSELNNFANKIEVLNSCFLKSEINEQVDGIFCNPPYFESGIGSPNNQKKIARHTAELNYESLIIKSTTLLKTGGFLSLIFPAELETKLRYLLTDNQFYISQSTHLIPKEKKKAERIILMARFKQYPEKESITESIILRKNNGENHEQFLKLINFCNG